MSSSESTVAKETPASSGQIAVCGVGAVSPAGWGMDCLREVLREKKRAATQKVDRPGRTKPLQVRRVPSAEKRAAFLSHARLRRGGPVHPLAIAAAGGSP